MREASIKSRKSGEKNISANTVRKVTEVCVIGLTRSGLDPDNFYGSWLTSLDTQLENIAQVPGIKNTPRHQLISRQSGNGTLY